MHPMNQLRTALIFIGWYLAMAIGGSVLCGLVGYAHYLAFGFMQKPSDAVIVPMELTAAMMSGILITGSAYCRIFPVDNIQDMKAFFRWRIHLLHLITLGCLVADAVSAV